MILQGGDSFKDENNCRCNGSCNIITWREKHTDYSDFEGIIQHGHQVQKELIITFKLLINNKVHPKLTALFHLHKFHFCLLLQRLSIWLSVSYV